jgi:hypothetical protein
LCVFVEPALLVFAWGEDVAGVGSGDLVPFRGTVGWEVTEIPDDGNRTDVVVVGVEDGLDILTGLRVLDTSGGLPCPGVAAVVVPGGVDELVRA